MIKVSVGDNSTKAPRLVPISVQPGTTTVLTNVSGSPLNYFTNGVNGSPTVLAVGNNVSLSWSCWMQSQGTSVVTLQGGFHGK